MLRYTLQRLLLFIPTLLALITLSFIIIQLLPGGPVEQMMLKLRGQGLETHSSGNLSLNPENRAELEAAQLKQLRELYGFDRPWWIRFFDWVKRLFTFQFGESYFYHREVTDLIQEKLPVSMSLGIITFFLTYSVCIPLGLYKAVRSGSKFDIWSSIAILFGYSVPGFILGVFLIVLFAGGSFWDFFPLRGLVSDNFHELSTWEKIKDYLHHLFLPILCMSFGSFAVMTHLTRNVLVEQLQQLYVLTARSKGLSEKRVLWLHVLRNGMIPLVTGFAGNFLTMFFGASLLIETLFSLDGLGLLSYEAVIRRDYPVVMANLFIFSLLYMLGRLLSDLIYVWVDPRISFKRQT